MQAIRLQTRRLGAAILLATPLCAAAQAAGNDLSHAVEIDRQALAQEMRRDVTSVCPNILADLPDALASAWKAVGRTGTVIVNFTLDGDRVRDIRALSGPRLYARWVRSAMQDMDCHSDRPQRQAFQFEIRFVDIYDKPEHGAVALVTP